MLTVLEIVNQIRQNPNKVALHTATGDFPITGVHTIGPNQSVWAIVLGGEHIEVQEADTLIETAGNQVLMARPLVTPFHVWNFDDFFANQVIVHNSSGATAMISLNQGDQYCCPDPGPPGAGNWTRLANCI